MDHDDFRLDTRFTDSSQKWQKPAAIVAAIVFVIGIILTMTTDVASRVLPMDERYLDALIPQAPDNAEPLSLKTLDHEINDKTLLVRGTVENRTDYAVSGLAAVIQPLDIHGVPAMPVEVPLTPPEVQAHMAGAFESTVTLNERPSGYSVKFRLVEGPFIPHKDERAVDPIPTIVAPTLTP